MLLPQFKNRMLCNRLDFPGCLICITVDVRYFVKVFGVILRLTIDRSGNDDNCFVAFNALAGLEQGFGGFARAKERCAVKLGSIGDCDKGQRVKTVFIGKGFGFFQGFPRNGGDMDGFANQAPVKHQLVHLIRRKTVQGLANLGFAGLVIRSRRIGSGIKDLRIRNDKLCGDAAVFKRSSRLTQKAHLFRKSVVIQLNLVYQIPFAALAMQKSDAVMAEVQGEIRLHRIDLAHIVQVFAGIFSPSVMIQQVFAERKASRQGIACGMRPKGQA